MSDDGGVPPAGPRSRLDRTLWIAAAVAFLLLLIWFATRMLGVAEPGPAPPAPTDGGALAALLLAPAEA